MTTRLATAAVGLPILFGAVWLEWPLGKPIWFAGLIFVVGAIAVLELARLVNLWGDKFHPAIPLAMTMFFMLVPGLSRALGHNPNSYGFFIGIMDIVAVGMCPLAGWILGSSRKVRMFDAPPIMILRISIYLGLSLYYALQIRFMEGDGREWTLLLLLVVFATDTSAYLVGRAAGRTPLAPSISPNKTREGAVAGLVGAIVASVMANSLLGLDAIIWEAAALGVIIGVLGQVGDLAESRMKRKAGVKDSGWLFPGHGGILDRLDSIVYVLPATHLFIIWEIQQKGLLS